jgi:hypothetical protein
MIEVSNLKTKSCIVWDSGGWCYVAERLAKSFGKVYYTVPLTPPEFPKAFSGLLGKGMRDVERLPADEALRLADSVDLHVTTDVNQRGLQSMLRKRGYAVWGMGDASEIETDRWKLGDVLKEHGLATPERELLKGTDALEKYLKSHKDMWVKINHWRGDMETFHHETPALSEPWLKMRLAEWGVVRYEMEFVVEKNIKGEEVAYDGPGTVDGEFCSPCVFGFEIKDSGYAGRIVPKEKLPTALIECNEKLSSFFKKNGSRGSYGNEVRIASKKEFYLTDPTCRMSSPPMQAICEAFTNLPEFIYEGAHGRLIAPEHEAKFFSLAIIKSSAENPKIEMPIEYPKEWYDFVKFRNVYFRNGKAHVLPQETIVQEIGAVVGLGDTLKEAMEMAKEIGESVKGYKITTSLGAIDEAEKVINDAKKVGVDFYA